MDEERDEPESGHLTSVTVPVIADSLPRSNALDLARCVYFTITAHDPAKLLSISLPSGQVVDFQLLGLRGIITRPSQGSEDEFVAPDLLEGLISTIEQDEDFSVDTEYLWIPTYLLDSARRLPASREGANVQQADRGDVFRVDRRFFADAWRAAQGGVDFDDFATRTKEAPVGEGPDAVLRFSPLETDAIKKWSEEQVRIHAEFRR
jgi:hypothetical protein